MAAKASAPTPTPATKPYDPVKAMEGMFNGSVTRIAYALKDPVNFGASTKTVLTEVAKRFHDALDDCEIQLLDAKWHLEHLLAQNRLRREAKARELSTTVKRKHEETQDAPSAQDETPTKKAKVDQGDQKAPGHTKMKEPEPDTVPRAAPKDEGDKKEEGKETEDQPNQDDFAKPTPQATPAATNEEFNFESMFGDPTADATENESFGFGLGLENDSLDALLPGLEDYANQPMENQTSNQDPDALPAFSNDFDLPEIGGTNAFDDFLNDDSLGGNLDTAVDLDDQNLLNMDFDESLFG